MPPIYPFTAIVGQERMKRSLILNAVDPRILQCRLQIPQKTAVLLFHHRMYAVADGRQPHGRSDPRLSGDPPGTPTG